MVVMVVVAVPAVEANLLLGDEVFGERAQSVEIGLVGGGQQVAERTRHVFRELRLAHGR